jgi:uncharacterized protein (TIGR00255 family)
MPKSMTGYGVASAEFEGALLTIEIRGVNNRYLDCEVRTPRAYAFAEDKLRKMVQASCKRGKLELRLTVDWSASGDVNITPNLAIARAYVDAFCTIAQECAVPNDFGTAALSRLPDVFSTAKRELDPATFSLALKPIASTALLNLNAMRSTEGAKLAEDINAKLTELEAFAADVAKRSPESVKAYRERLTERMKEILESKMPDETRLLTEAALFADKVAVDEELTRLKSHIAQSRETLKSSVDDGVGKKLDFLTQELNREVNTIGSKCVDLEITKTVVEMKAIVEKIREQVQNLE